MWPGSEEDNDEATIKENMIPQIVNALIFRFVAWKTIGVKDLELALNAIWKPDAPINPFAVGNEVYLVGFENAADYNRVLAKQS